MPAPTALSPISRAAQNAVLLGVIALSGCSKPVPPGPVDPSDATGPSAPTAQADAVAPATGDAPQPGWYNGACYAALDGEVDTALALLARSIAEGEAPLEWMAEDPDLVVVRADARWTPTRDAALDTWIDGFTPTSGADWLKVAQARQIQGRDPTEALVAGEAAGLVHTVFGPRLDAVTPALQAREDRRAAFLAERRGTVTVETPHAFELANIVLSQTGYGQTPNATNRDSAYAAEVDAWFSPHRDHPLIAELDALPVDIGVYYAFRNQSAAWTLEGGALTPSDVYPVGGFWGADPFAERLDLLEDFVATTDAQTFLDDHASEYTRRIDAYEQAVPIRAMWDWLEARFPAEGDGREALVVRTSPLIGGSHNASTLEVDGFREGTMVVPIGGADGIPPEDVGPFCRMVFTEIDHHYVNPVSARMPKEIDAAIADWRAFNEQEDGMGYGSAALTFNEYATWVLFEVWWSEYCDEHGCSEAMRRGGEEDPVAVMERRGFSRYTDFRDAMVPQLKGQNDLEAMFPTMLAWFEAEQR